MQEDVPLLTHLPPNGKKNDCFPIQCRHILAGMAAMGFAVVYALRVNLSVALVAMVNQTYVKERGTSIDSECQRNESDTGLENVRVFILRVLL